MQRSVLGLRRALLVAAALVAALAAPAATLADTPGGGPTRYLAAPAGFTFTLYAGDFCSADDVQVVFAVSRMYEMDFVPRPDGATMSIITGALIVTMTNAATGQSLTVNSSGPMQITAYPDGSGRFVVEGNALVWEYGVGIIYVRGTFNLLTGEIRGTSTNLCGALGA